MIHRHPILTIGTALVLLLVIFLGTRRLLAERHRLRKGDGVVAQVLGHSFVTKIKERPKLRYLLETIPLVVACLLLCGAVILAYLRHQSRIASSIVKALHEGNLNARLPTTQLARFGGLVDQFNAMAGDIESLVGKLREGEKSRSETLKELAHDVRTPLGSLRLLVDKWSDEKTKWREKKTEAALKKDLSVIGWELGYLERIVESFVLLAQIEEPDFKPPPGELSVSDLLSSEVLRIQDAPEKLHLEWTYSPCSDEVIICGEGFLITRAIRNALENASTHARQKVEVILKTTDASLEIRVRDDGPGFSPEALKGFGRRKNIRLVDASSSPRVSIGLGSVILRRIVENHGGEVTVENAPGGGALLTLRLPRVSARKAA